MSFTLPAANRSSHTIALDDLLRDFNTALLKARQMGQQGASTGAYGGAPAASVLPTNGVSRTMLVTALRQLDDLVVLDETTNTVRGIARHQGQGSAGEPTLAAGVAAAPEVAVA